MIGVQDLFVLALVLLLTPAVVTAETILIDAALDATLIEDTFG